MNNKGAKDFVKVLFKSGQWFSEDLENMMPCSCGNYGKGYHKSYSINPKFKKVSILSGFEYIMYTDKLTKR